MQRQHNIRQGEIYWIDNFPALDGHLAKRRPVIVVGRVDPADPNSPILAVGISHTAGKPETDPDMLPLPDTQHTPTARTGLNRPSWALPRWAVIVDAPRFATPCGHVKGELLRKIVEAVSRRRSRPTV